MIVNAMRRAFNVFRMFVTASAWILVGIAIVDGSWLALYWLALAFAFSAMLYCDVVSKDER